ILRQIERQPSRAAGYKQLVRELGLRGGEERRELDERLRKLVARGELVENGRDRYALPSAPSRSNLVAGTLSMHRDGCGFVTPENAELRQRISGDIYIAPPEIGVAMHGDRVLVEIGPIRPDGRAEGRIVKVARRRHNTVVGTFHYGERFNYVKPYD